ncbi:MAG: UDP-glucose/GDP-mannose dehydrogenase family protein [Pseudomonadota bacterium]
MQVVMIGAGYVGLVSATCFSEFGHSVVCVDSNQHRVDALKSGQIPIFEPGLDELVACNQDRGSLSFTTDMSKAVQQADVIFIAVGTPSRRGDGHADLSFVFQAVREVATALDHDAVIVIKSTVPVGTAAKAEAIARKANAKIKIDVVSNPEFLREGSAVEDFMRPDRIVIGTNSQHAESVMRHLYRPHYLNETPMVITNPESSELIKYASNAYLASRVTFINEVANLCERCGADVQTVAKGMGLDGRIGSKFLHAGPGYGGSCFPKDTRALVQTAKDYGVDLNIVQSAVTVNEERKLQMVDKIISACGGNVQNKTLAILGVAFKPNTDDTRESPSLKIIRTLQSKSVNIRVFDPKGRSMAEPELGDAYWANDTYDAVAGADAVVIITEWNEFRALDMARLKVLLKAPVMVDLRNIYQPKEMAASGFDYFSVGRETAFGASKLSKCA